MALHPAASGDYQDRGNGQQGRNAVFRKFGTSLCESGRRTEMKKEAYEVPVFEVESFVVTDIVCASTCPYKTDSGWELPED